MFVQVIGPQRGNLFYLNRRKSSISYELFHKQFNESDSAEIGNLLQKIIYFIIIFFFFQLHKNSNFWLIAFFYLSPSLFLSLDIIIIFIQGKQQLANKLCINNKIKWKFIANNQKATWHWRNSSW